MPITSVFIVLIVIGVLLWLIGKIPMPADYYMLIRTLTIILVVLWLLGRFVDLGALRVLRTPR